jgi:hypothetical protein
MKTQIENTPENQDHKLFFPNIEDFTGLITHSIIRTKVYEEIILVGICDILSKLHGTTPEKEYAKYSHRIKEMFNQELSNLSAKFPDTRNPDLLNSGYTQNTNKKL